MRFNSALSGALLATATVSAVASNDMKNPCLKVPECPSKATAEYAHTVPDRQEFPLTQVDLCWDEKSIHLSFKAFNETNFYFDPEHGTNDDIWKYEVMEAFIHQGSNDPQTYLEFEVSPNNVTYQAMIFNPSKVRAEGAPFDHFFVSDPAGDGFTSSTTLDREAETWISDVTIPLALWNVEKIRGTKWRMNFLRTTTSPETYPDQGLGAWSPPDEANFHVTSFFGDVKFV